MYRTTLLGLLGAAAATALIFSAQAKALMEANISSEDALVAYDAAIAACRKSNSNDITVVIVDRAGKEVLMARSDGAALHNLDLARRKAYTARTFRATSTEWRDRSSGTQGAAGQRYLTDVIPLGGGVPIMLGQDAIGGVGVSGSNGGQPGDEACAKAGADAAAAASR
jgi:uncharacterized protein GlcG (DUF336 family)